MLAGPSVLASASAVQAEVAETWAKPADFVIGEQVIRLKAYLEAPKAP